MSFLVNHPHPPTLFLPISIPRLVVSCRHQFRESSYLCICFLFSFFFLGNDPEEDSDREPDPPTKAIDKPTNRYGKRDAPKAAPEPPVTATRGGGAGRGRRGGFTGNEEGKVFSFVCLIVLIIC